MGGGTRGKRISYSIASRNVNRKVADYDEKKAMPESKRNVFVSFHMNDEYAKQLLISQAKNDKFDLEFINYAINEPFDEKWKTQCAERIKQCSVVIVMIGKETHKREAVLWEINEAHRQGKRVIGVRIHRYEKHKIPGPLRNNRSKIINWDINKISEELGKD